MTEPRRLAVIFDAVEERWPSMEYVSEMLLKHLQAEHGDRFNTSAVRPSYFAAFERLPGFPQRLARNADRFVTRFLRYPVQLMNERQHFDLFHVADHTYAQLVHVLPKGRVGVFCHDLDAFEPVLDGSGTAALWRIQLARILLDGLKRADLVFFSTEQIRDRILELRLVDRERLVHAPYGLADEYWTPADDNLPSQVRKLDYILNVAGNFPRKRLDVLFRVFARLRKGWPELYLVQHGAKLNEEQRQIIRELGISDRFIQTSDLSRAGMAALYCGARLVLLTSESEGFGLPALEALATGAIVVASDIAPFREVADQAGIFCPVGNIDSWADVVGSLLEGSSVPPPIDVRLAQARRFSWQAHARTVADAYANLGEPR